ncbi:hypothetical protein ACU6U9_22415 [Pseudomonas sp. HK3]
MDYWGICVIEVVSGHLGSGNWCFKSIDGITVLAHMQPFNRHNEFRIGPDQVLNYEIEESQNKKKHSKIRINLTGDRYCRAWVSSDDLNMLGQMVDSQQPAPEFKRENKIWVSGLIAFLIACVVFEFVK